MLIEHIIRARKSTGSNRTKHVFVWTYRSERVVADKVQVLGEGRGQCNTVILWYLFDDATHKAPPKTRKETYDHNRNENQIHYSEE